MSPPPHSTNPIEMFSIENYLDRAQDTELNNYNLGKIGKDLKLCEFLINPQVKTKKTVDAVIIKAVISTAHRLYYILNYVSLILGG